MSKQTIHTQPLLCPRIEVYSEVDLGDPKAAENTWTDPFGKKVYGGARDYKPHIQRRIYPMNDQALKTLLKMPMSLPGEFGEPKDKITFQTYIDLSKKDGSVFRTLFPKDLSYINKLHPDNIQYSNIKLLYELTQPRSITIIWLDENTWYVDELFYAIEDLYLLQEKINPAEDIVAEGSFEDFLRYSALFQSKLGEGFAELKPTTKNPVVPLNEEVFGYTVSPGLPNTDSIYISIAGDGSILWQGTKTGKQVNPHIVAHILMAANRISWDHQAKTLTPPPIIAHDKQVVTLSVWNRGKHYKLQDPDLSENWSPLTHFVKNTLKMLR